MSNIDNYIRNIEVSVIIPCYNSEKNILKTLESLEMQEYSNFEVVIINDGSRDKTEDLIMDYLKKSNLLYQYIKKTNEGVSIARNKGIEVSRGKYITFLDSDDVYHKKYLDLLVNIINNRNVDTVYCAYTRDTLNINNKNEDKIKIKYLNHNKLMKNFMYRKGPCVFSGFIYKKSIIEKYNIKFDDNTKYGEDLEFVWKYLVHCQDGIFIKKNLYVYYNNPESAVNNINWRIVDLLTTIKRVEEYMYKYNDTFLKNFKKYMYDRAIWSIAKEFCINDSDKLFIRFIETYEVRRPMKNMVIKGPHILIKVTSALFLFSPQIFYKLMRKVKHR